MTDELSLPALFWYGTAMGFSTVTFLFYFLPACLAVYYVSRRSIRNTILLCASLLFYVLTAGSYVFLLLLSALFNWWCGRCLYKRKEKKVLFCVILFNLFIMVFFRAPGVSFFSFQAIAYLVDIERGIVKQEDDLLSLLLYFTFFAKLLSGPIVRYEEMKDDLDGRQESADQFTTGIMRFVRGLFYKCVLAETLLEMTGVFTVTSVLSSWLNAISALLYIAFDFIAYSDMAIGIGLFFGFRLPENFNYPLMAHSVRDFWRRWHMTLTRFFKDYVYIPLGGSRRSGLVVVRNVMVVWLLTGLWHGRQWNYVLWGIYFGLFVILEKCLTGRWLEGHKVVSHVYTLLVVVIGFVLFQNEISVALLQLQSMAGFGVPLADESSLYYAKSYLPFFVLAVGCGTPVFSRLYQRIVQRWQYAELLVMVVLFVVAVSFLLHGGFTPFVYFRY